MPKVPGGGETSRQQYITHSLIRVALSEEREHEPHFDKISTESSPPPTKRRKNENLLFTSPLYYCVTNLMQITFSISRYHPAQSRDVGGALLDCIKQVLVIHNFIVSLYFLTLSLSLSMLFKMMMII